MRGRSLLGSLRAKRSLLAVVAVGTALALLTVALVVAVAPSARPVANPAAAEVRRNGTVVDADQLVANGLLGQIGTQPYASLVHDARSQARRALQRDPNPGPLPDAVADLRDDGKAVLALAIDYVLEGDPRHLRGAATYLDAWASGAAVDPDCLKSACDRMWRVARDLPAFVLAADLVRGSAPFTGESADRFGAWLRDMSPAGPVPDDVRGDAAVLARMAISAYLRDDDGLDSAVAEWRSRLDLIDADGRLAMPATETAPLAAAQEALTYRLLAARIAEASGRSVIDAKGTTGATIRMAVDRLAHQWVDPADRPLTAPASRPPAGPLWELAYGLWPDATFLPMRTEYRAGDGGDLVAFRWSTLFEAGPVTTAGATKTSGGAVPSGIAPTVVPTAFPTPSPTPRPTPNATPRPGPQVEPPTVAFRLGAAPVGRSAVRVSWSSAVRVEGDRSALSYRLEAAVDDGGYRTVPSGARRRVDRSLEPGHRYRFRVRATSEAAGAGPWSDAVDMVFRRYQDGDRAVDLAGSWSTASSPAYSDGRVRYSKQDGSTMTLRFHGRAVAVRAPIGPTRGEVVVIVDGAAVTRLDLGARDFVGSVVVFERSWATAGNHSIQLRVVGTPGRPVVAIDAFDVVDGKE